MLYTAINFLKSKPPGTFVIRNSNSFPGAFGLAVRVARLPPNVQPKKASKRSRNVTLLDDEVLSIENTPRASSVRENVRNNSKKRRVMFFGFSKKNVKKRTYNFSWLFNVYCSSSLLSESDIVHTRCSAMTQNGSHSSIWELNYSDH